MTVDDKPHKLRWFDPWPLFLLGVFTVLGLSACAPPAEPSPPAPATQPPAATATPTIIWFPATNTPTPLPPSTPSPTPPALPGVGGLILQDDFSDPALWSTRTSDQVFSVVENSRLYLVARVPKLLFIVDRRSPTPLADFYAELTARTSLCLPGDEYGLLVRYNSFQDFYRFTVNCDGSIRADRVREGVNLPLQPPVFSGDAPRGAPGEVRIGVWAAGTELRLFLNGRYQFTINDPSFRNGGLAVFARAGGETQLSVNFADLIVNDVSYASPTPTFTPTLTPTPTRTPRP